MARATNQTEDDYDELKDCMMCDDAVYAADLSTFEYEDGEIVCGVYHCGNCCDHEGDGHKVGDECAGTFRVHLRDVSPEL